MSELKPCPFCGGNAKMFSAKANAAGTRFVYWVECNGSMCKCSPKTENYYTKEEAAKAWNKRASDWIPCSERMPEKDTSVLISAQGHRVSAFYDAVKGVFMLTETEGLFYSMSAVTHWMPLPDPPEEGGDP